MTTPIYCADPRLTALVRQACAELEGESLAGGKIAATAILVLLKERGWLVMGDKDESDD